MKKYIILLLLSILFLSCTPTKEIIVTSREDSIIIFNNNEFDTKAIIKAKLNELISITVRKDGYISKTEEFEITNEITEKYINIIPKPITLNITSSHKDLDIYINKKKYKSNSIELDPGKYELEIEKNGYEKYRKMIELNIGEINRNINVKLDKEKSSGYTINRTNPIKSFSGEIYLSEKQKLSKWHQRDTSITITNNFSEKHLVSTKWFVPLDDPVKFSSKILMFFSDTVFWYGTYQNGAYIKGNYELIENKVKLYNIVDVIDEDGWRLEDIFYNNEEIYLDINKTPSYNYSITLENELGLLQFAADGTEPLINEKINIWGFNSIFENKAGIISAETPVFLSPETKATNIYIEEFGSLQLVKDEQGNDEHKFIESKIILNKDIEIQILAKSELYDSYFCRVPVKDEYYRWANAWISSNNVKIIK
ncbi:MAG: PEGA domain-containing protein [Spirochaetaceae bacterium]